MGFAGGRRPRRDRSRLLDSQQLQLDECYIPRFARPSICDSRAGRPESRALVSAGPYCAASLAHACTYVPGLPGGHIPARSRPARSKSGPR
jgi:hypothetical protein